MNTLLSRQIHKFLGNIDTIPKELLPLFDSISEAYEGFDKDRNLIERSLDLSSKELMDVNQKLRQEVEVRKQAEQSVLEREIFLSDILESIQDGISVLSPDLDIIRVNGAMEKYYAHSIPLEGKKCYQAYHMREKKCENCPCLRALETGELEMEEVKLVNKDEVAFDLELFAFPILDASGKPTGVVEYVRDISQRKEAERKQVSLLEQVMKSNEELTRLAYVMTHDLKTPLRGISTLTEWLKNDHSSEISKEAKTKLEQLDIRTQRMHSLIDGLLAYTRLISSPCKIDAININDLIQDVISSLDLPENIKINIKRELPVIKCEQNRMTQIFHHLIQNSARFIDKSAGLIEINFTERPKYWEFSISDNGPGIEKKYHDKIFKMFQTLERWEVSGYAGIGLSLVKKAVETHGGQIWIESNVLVKTLSDTY
ncbi:MAG: PAS domain-containing protein [Sedimentisphaerales bacterium]|nr:PAS domain-containing protein [Sedimentisphaerales bacterium]